MNTTTMVPFVKWAGGKRQMLEQLYIRMPDTYNAYYEPFVGGGAMVLSLAPEEARLTISTRSWFTPTPRYAIIWTRFWRS